MGDKHSLLTREEVESTNIRHVINEELVRLSQFKGSSSNVKVLDFGCGRGAAVLKMLLLGYEAFGVDVDPGPVRNGEAVFRSLGYSPEERLFLCENDSLPFETASFDLVFSEEVLEHIRSLEGYVKELARVSRQGGVGVHFFPAKWVMKEPHVYVPFVHWLPKNSFRRWWLKQNRSLLPTWHGHDKLTRGQRIDEFYDYLNQKTYYRSNKSIRNVFRNAGFATQFIGTFRALTFHNVILVTRKK